MQVQLAFSPLSFSPLFHASLPSFCSPVRASHFHLLPSPVRHGLPGSPPMSLSSPALRSPFHCPRHSHLTPAGVLSRCVASSASFTTSVTIEAADNRTDPISHRPFTLFHLAVTFHCSTCGVDQWAVQKRYSEFDELHSLLLTELADVSPPPTSSPTATSQSPHRLPSLPPKKFLGSSLDPPFITERRQQLELYLNRLISDDALHSSPALIRFLQHPSADVWVALNDQIEGLRAHNIQLQAQMREMQTTMRLLTGGPTLPNGHILPSTSPTSVLKELSRLKRRVRMLESAPASSLAGEDEGEGGWSGASIRMLGRSRSQGGVVSDEEDSEGGGLHKDSMSRVDRARSLSQRGAATREKRRYRRGLGGGASGPQGEEEVEELEEGEERGRSLSESHVMDRLAMRHFHYRTSTPYRQNPFMQKGEKRSGVDGGMGGVSSIKEEESPLRGVVDRTVRSGRHSEPIANHYYKPFMRNGKGTPSPPASTLPPPPSSFFAAFGPTLQRTPFPSTSSAPAAFSQAKQGGSALGHLLQQRPAQPSHVPRSPPDMHEGEDEGGADLVLGSSPSTSAMALISEGVANAVLDSTPNASPLNSPLPIGQRQLERGESDGEGSMSERGTGQGSGGGERRRHSLLNKIPPPQLKLNNSSHAPQPHKEDLPDTSTSTPSASAQPEVAPPEEEKRLSTPPIPTPAVTKGSHATSPSEAVVGSPRLAAPPGLSPSSASSMSAAPVVPSADALYSSCLDTELHGRLTELILFIQPSAASEQRYTAVFSFIDSLIRRTIGAAEVFCHGSFALKTYLPDADLDVSAFFSKSNDDSWIHRLMSALLQEAAGGGNTPATPSGLPSKDKERSRDRDRQDRERDSTAASPPPPKAQFPVKSVTFISAETAVVKAQIGHVSVDISGNQTGALSTLALFEEVDQLVGKDHLFKRTILLATTYFKNELIVSGSHAGFLSSYAIRTFVLFIFNRFHNDIHSPLQGLYKLMLYLSHFDWNLHAFGLFGPIELAGLPKFVPVTSGPTAWPPSLTPLVTSHLLQSYTYTTNEVSSSAVRSFPPKYINVIDPANLSNNLGRSVSHQNVHMIRTAMVDGAQRLHHALIAWGMRSKVASGGSSVSSPAATTDRGEESGAVSSSAPAASTPLTSNHSPLSSSLPPTDEDLESLQIEEDQQTAYRLISQLFERTLQAYSGRTAFTLSHRGLRKHRPAALPILQADGQPLSLSDKGGPPHHTSSSPATPSLSSTPSSPALGSSSLLISDSELETESELASPTDRVHSPHPPIHPPHPHAPHTLLDGHLPSILSNLHHARAFDTPDISEPELTLSISRILTQCGSVPVGKLGSLLHNVMGNHSLPSMLKEKFGGLKRFLERHGDMFVIGTDHPFNPHVHLVGEGMGGRGGVGAEGYQQGEGVGGMGASGMGGPDGGAPRPSRSNRPSSRPASQGQGQGQPQGRGGQGKQSGGWGHHSGGAAVTAMGGRPSGNPHHALSPQSPVTDHPSPHSASPVRHTPASAVPQHRFPSTSPSVAIPSPFPSLPHQGGRAPHPRFASTEGLNVTAPAFVSSYEGGGGDGGGLGGQGQLFFGFEEYGGSGGVAGGGLHSNGVVGSGATPVYHSHHSRYKQ